MLLLSKQMLNERHTSTLKMETKCDFIQPYQDGSIFSASQFLCNAKILGDLFHEMSRHRDSCFSSDEIDNLKVSLYILSLFFWKKRSFFSANDLFKKERGGKNLSFLLDFFIYIILYIYPINILLTPFSNFLCTIMDFRRKEN